MLLSLQKIMTDFVNVEMSFHAKALEVYTQCFNNIAAIDIDEDIEVMFLHKWSTHTCA